MRATFIIIIWVLIGFAVGAVFFGELGPLMGIPAMEGKAGFFGLFFGGPVGAIAGGILGFFLSGRYADDERKQRRVFGLSLLVIPALVLGGVVFELVRTSDQLNSNGSRETVHYELRLPASAPAPAKIADVALEIRTAKETINPPNYDGAPELRRDGNRTVIHGYFALYRAAPKRVVALRIGGGPTYLFTLRLPARPTHMSGYSDWYAVDEVDDNTPGQAPRPPRPDEALEIRHYFF